MQTTRRFAALVAVLGLALAACSSGESQTPASLLGNVLAKGTIVMSTDTTIEIGRAHV